jgi:Kef-type K+ transport system membrane component KefB
VRGARFAVVVTIVAVAAFVARADDPPRSPFGDTPKAGNAAPASRPMAAGSGSGSPATPSKTASGSAAPSTGSAAPSTGSAAPATGSAAMPAPTPPVNAGSAANPAATGSAAPPEAEKPKEHTSDGTVFAIKVIGGLVALLVLAYLGGHRRVVRYQERLGVSGVITAGFPFVFLGAIASLPSIGILSGDVLTRLRPVLHFGLGWLGFIIGAQLDIRVLDRVPKGTAYLILVEALGPFGITAFGCGAVMFMFGSPITDPALWRNAILLGTAAAMTAPRKFRGFANRTWHEGRGVDILLGQLDELAGVVGLLFITAYFREPAATTWTLPSTAWVFVSLGLGVAIGVLIFAMVRVPVSNAEFLAVVLGGIAFAAGLAGYLQLSPIVICFIAGVLVTNFPNDQRESIFRILRHLERPVHLLFLMIAGAVWSINDWRGWALVPVFVAGRALGKWTGVIAARTAVGSLLPIGFADDRRLVTPLSSLSIGLVVSVESLYHDTGLPWVITAVIGGSVITEFLVQATDDGPERVPVDELDAAAPIDELDDHDSGEHEPIEAGPIYRDDEPQRPRTNPAMPVARATPVAGVPAQRATPVAGVPAQRATPPTGVAAQKSIAHDPTERVPTPPKGDGGRR